VSLLEVRQSPHAYRTVSASILSPLVIVAGWSLSLGGQLAPTSGWVLNAIAAYPVFWALLGVCLLLFKAAGLRRSWQQTIAFLVVSLVVAEVFRTWLFGTTYDTYQFGKTTIVANSHITPEGMKLLLGFSVRDGVLFAMAFVLFLVICGAWTRTKEP
jgi:hypothetical protein